MDGTTDSTETETGLFGAAIFRDPEARKLRRIGVVDVGSNSVRLVVFDGAARSPAYFYNEKIMCGLGAGIQETGRLNPEGRVRAVSALRRFAALARAMRLPGLTLVATAAVRDAEDGRDFCAEVRRETGLDVVVIDGTEEARLSAQGVLLGWPGSYGLVSDIGGASMELAEIKGGKVGRRVTSPLGPLKLAGISDDADIRAAHIDKVLDALVDKMGPQRDRLFLVGGSWRAFARLDMLRRGYPLHVLHEYRMTREAVLATAEFIAAEDHDKVRAEAGVSSARMALVPLAMEVLTRLLQRFEPKDIAVSSYGIREGLLYEQMPQKVRDRDPLIEACRFAEAKDARLPGFGKTLFKFVRPLFPEADAARLRIVKAACLLHDVSWRAHPDYRAEVCFDNATRANLGGLKHEERVYLGLALLHRYRGSRDGTAFEELYRLMDPGDIHEAEVLGRAMRLGAMLWMRKDTEMAALDWSSGAARLALRLPEDAAGLFGEVAEARLSALARTLGAEASVIIGD